MSTSQPALRANFQKNYLMRYVALTAATLFMALWFGYDGLIGYPAQIPAAEAYDELKLRELDAAERIESWQKIAEQNNWSKEVPKKSAQKIRDDIYGQYIWGILNLLIGVPALVYLLRSKDSWVEETESGVRTSWGQALNFADVKKLDKRKWANKGIAKAYYATGGRARKFVFDDFKFDREPLGKMLRRLESVLTPEQITGGPPEKPLSEDAQSDTKTNTDGTEQPVECNQNG